MKISKLKSYLFKKNKTNSDNSVEAARPRGFIIVATSPCKRRIYDRAP